MAQAKKKRKFFDVEIPSINKTTQLRAFEIEDLNDKYMKYDLTRILRGKGMELQLKVKVKDSKAIAEPTRIKLLPYYMKRIVRKGTNYIEDSFSTSTKNAPIRVKPFLITRRKVSKAVRRALRNKCREELEIYVKEKPTNEIFEDIFSNKLQKTLSLKLKKVYPLSACEIRVLKVEENKE
jgi:ribosomal protein S3AE